MKWSLIAVALAATCTPEFALAEAAAPAHARPAPIRNPPAVAFKEVPRPKADPKWQCRPSGHVRTAMHHYANGNLPQSAQAMMRAASEADLCPEAYATLMALKAHVDAKNGEHQRCTRAFEIVRTLAPEYVLAPGTEAQITACFDKAKPKKLGLSGITSSRGGGLVTFKGTVHDELRLASRLKVQVRFKDGVAPLIATVGPLDRTFSVSLPESLADAKLQFALTTNSGALVYITAP